MLELSLWTALLLPAFAWALQHEIVYALTPFRCYGGTRLPIYLVSIVALVLSVSAGGLAFRNWKKVSKVWPNEASDSTSHVAFMSVLGLMSSFIFSLVIVAAIIATVILHPCWR
jgi:lysylphosphatidylglycerol synthetase-like protein (DUF2156 family)